MHLYELNISNKLGTKGQLALRYSELLKEVSSYLYHFLLLFVNYNSFLYLSRSGQRKPDRLLRSSCDFA